MAKTLFKRGDALQLGSGNVGVVYSAEKSNDNSGIYLIGFPNSREGVDYIEMTDEELLMNGFSKVGEAKYVR